MSHDIQHFQDLMTRLRAGSDDAARELVAEFAPHVYRAVKRRFRHRRVRVFYETDDCIQSVWFVVFSHMERVASCEDPKRLVNYLARVASNKIIDRHREIFGRNSDGFQDHLESLEGDVESDDRVVSHELTPSQRAVIREEVQLQTRELSAEKQTIFNLFNEGYNSIEISERMEGRVSDRGIRRVLTDIFDRLRGRG